MANKTDELKKDQGTPEENGKEKETKETNPENKGEQGEKKEEKKSWSTGKKVGVGAGILLTVLGVGAWVKKKFFNGGDDEDDEE